MIGVTVVYLLHVAAAAVTQAWCYRVDEGGGSRSGHGRAANLYRRYLGINGKWFVHKTAAMQLTAVVLQATAKLSAFGSAVAMEGALGPTWEWAEWAGLNWVGLALKPLYWLLFLALVVNATVPFALLRCKRLSLQRDAVAALDVILDLVYFVTYFYSMGLVQAYPTVLPSAPYEYLSCFWPLLHCVKVARSIEAAEVHRLAEDEARKVAATTTAGSGGGGGDLRRRLSRREAMACSALALLTIAATLFWGGRRHYPFSGVWDGACQPCLCDGDGTLVSCVLPAKLKVSYLYLDDKGIAGIEPGAFEGLNYLKELSLSENDIGVLHAGMFDGLPHTGGLELSSNNISTIEPAAFRGLRSLRLLALRSNPITVLRTGALEEGDLDGLRNLFLDDCGRLREVEAGAMPGTLKNVWLSGASLNCSQIASRLPRGATCLDGDGAYCDATPIHWVGNGVCEEGDYIGDYDTTECAQDGGDCA
jgi:hypothetical protein